jgi:general secretion pathway protein A
MSPLVLNELHLLSSARFDSQSLLCIVLAGDALATSRLDGPDSLAGPATDRLHLG